jgi:hypothetical protein
MADKKRTSFYIDVECRERLRHLAQPNRRSMSGQLEYLIDQAWERREHPVPEETYAKT